jgi:hypothetical protein
MRDPSPERERLGAQCVFTSMTRIADLDSPGHELAPRPPAEWATGDYVAAEVLDQAGGRFVEAASGRPIELAEGDVVVGALGSRFATLELTGTWEDVVGDGIMHVLSGGGILGRLRSISTLIPDPPRVRYAGHVLRRGEKVTMMGSVRRAKEPGPFRAPVVLLTGTSMSAGKTSAAKVVIRRLKRMGQSVLGAKVTGAGRYRDVLAMKDAGADWILDFVDGGLPSTHCAEEVYREAMKTLLGRMAEVDADVAVVEIGASPLEPYNGAVATELLGERVALTILCASDPYSVAGAIAAYDARPDLVTGPTSNTEAGARLVARLTGLPTLDVRKKSDLPALEELLRYRLEGVAGRAASGDP